MQAEIAEVRASLLAEESNRRWVGILTDGHVWHSWSYEHRDQPSAQTESSQFIPSNKAELGKWLVAILYGDPVGKPWIPQNPVELFRDNADELREIHDDLTGENRLHTNTKKALWRDMLRSSGMEPQTPEARSRLFVAHSFLIALARGVVQTMKGRQEALDPIALLGHGIVAWIPATLAGRQWAESLFNHICRYEWRQRHGDVLRPLYEAFVERRDRRDFGEVYTPDWLAELLVRELLDDEWCRRASQSALNELFAQEPLGSIGVLDPCCGSGTFLYHSARRLLGHPSIAGRPVGEQSNIVSRLVCGIDIHPVACEFARATLLRALPCEPQSGEAALRVWNGDALMMQGAEESLFQARVGEVVVLSPAGNEIRLPFEFATHPRFQSLIDDMTSAATAQKGLPTHVENSVKTAEDRRMLRESHASLREIVKREGNSVWAWFIQQMVGPWLLNNNRADRIISNPPWVRMSRIQHKPRKRSLEQFSMNHGLWQGGRQAPNQDIAQLFIKRCRDLYLCPAAPAAWVVKHSAIRASNWEKFRDWRARNVVNDKILDLKDAQVFGGGDARKCCVLFDHCEPSMFRNVQLMEARCPNARPDMSTTLFAAEQMIEWQAAPPRLPQGESAYVGRFHAGASVIPHVLTVIDRQTRGADGMVRITTRLSRKGIWKEVNPQIVEVPTDWLAPLLRSENLLVFTLSAESPGWMILPRNAEGRLLEEESAREIAAWRKLDDIYVDCRGAGKHTPSTLLKRINYQRGADRQLPLLAGKAGPPALVLYPSSGDIMRGCRVQAATHLIDAKLISCTFKNPQEAAYLVALLNAPVLNTAFVQSRRSGRDFALHPWRRVPIPRYDTANGLHNELAGLCTEAEAVVKDWLVKEASKLPRGQVGRSKRIRKMLAQCGLAARIDDAARRLLPNQCR
ncbi:MAG: hypothetical protein OXB95_07995 [Rhodobacteraceae bacterium]|nr:hypothetical protein [Paracoccaceae bacterium]